MGDLADIQTDTPISGQDLLQQATEQYPFIKNHDIAVRVSPRDKKTWGYAETWLPGDSGWQGTPEQGYVNRPAEFPAHKIGIDIYQPNEFSSHDLAGEVLHGDPMANTARKLIAETLTQKQAQFLRNTGDYQMTVAPEDQRMNNAVDSMMRGHLLGQWPQEALREFGLTQEQKRHMDTLKNYMTSPSLGDLQRQ